MGGFRRCGGLATVVVALGAFCVGFAGPAPVALAGPASAEGVREVEPVFVRCGSVARSVAVGDMNNDGVVDLVTPNRGGGISVMLGSGAGGFDQPRHAAHPGQEDLGDSVVADLDDDGLLDFAVGDGFSPSLLVLRGVGRGRLDTAVSHPLVGVPESLTLADLNGDGDQDLLVVSPEADRVNVLLGTHGLGFSAAAPVTVGASPRGLAVADLDADGDLDFAVANRESNSVSVRYGDGTGLFPTGAEVPTRPAPQDVELRDLAGDGLMDLVVGSNGEPVADNGTVAILRGSGPGEFSEIRTYETLKFINSVTAADLDEDGYFDFVIGTGNNSPFGFGEPAPGYLSVVGGRPGGARIIVAKVGASASDVTVADLDGDADLDVVTTRGLTYVAILFDPLG